jgi:asparagine synthase (glutamine-hydrolysing)
MCGIAGIIGPNANRNLIEAMIKALAHRGPDGHGIYQDQDLFLGHARLSIIDLVTGDQPMSNENQKIWVVYNGEIYNFKELKQDLVSKGHFFRSTSDTEVLLHGYEEYGLSFLQKLDGIFAFALWDADRKRLILARDYYGIKPLHYRFDGENLYFASEIKAIIQDPKVPREIDFQSLHYFLNLRYIPGEGTLFKGINKLLPAHFLIFEEGRIKIEKYYSHKPIADTHHDENYYLEGIRFYLEEAVRKQMISDVPVGVYLSGGLDSSSIVAFMSKVTNSPIRTFSMGFNEPTDELSDAKVIADYFGTEHHEISLGAEPLRSLISTNYFH